MASRGSETLETRGAHELAGRAGTRRGAPRAHDPREHPELPPCVAHETGSTWGTTPTVHDTAHVRASETLIRSSHRPEPDVEPEHRAILVIRNTTRGK